MHQEWLPIPPGSDDKERNEKRKPGKPLKNWVNRLPNYVPPPRKPLEELSLKEQEETQAALKKLQADLHEPITDKNKRKTLRTISAADQEQLAKLYKESGLGNETPNNKLN